MCVYGHVTGLPTDCEPAVHSATSPPRQGEQEDVLHEPLCSFLMQRLQGAHGSGPSLCGLPLLQ